MDRKVKYPPRVNAIIRADQAEKLQKLLPWGVKCHVVEKVIDMVIELIEEHGEHVIGFILEGKIGFKIVEDKRDENSGRPKEHTT